MLASSHTSQLPRGLIPVDAPPASGLRLACAPVPSLLPCQTARRMGWAFGFGNAEAPGQAHPELVLFRARFCPPGAAWAPVSWVPPGGPRQARAGVLECWGSADHIPQVPANSTWCLATQLLPRPGQEPFERGVSRVPPGPSPVAALLVPWCPGALVPQPARTALKPNAPNRTSAAPLHRCTAGPNHPRNRWEQTLDVACC